MGKKRKKRLVFALWAVLILFTGSTGIAAAKDAKEAPEMDSQFVIETVETNDFSMDYLKFGHGEKTLVILPGLSVQSVMGSAEAVVQAYQQMTDDFTIYVFDRRKELPAGYSVQDMAEDTAQALRAAGLDRTDLFGASQGGMIAMEIAIRHPELVEKLVLGSTTACITEEQFPLFESWIRLAKEQDAQALYLSFGEALYPEDVFEQSKDLLIEAAKSVTEEDLQRFIILAEALKGFDITDELSRIACPVLLLGSEDDRVLGADAASKIAEQLKKRPDFELYMYAGYGHAAYDTAPDYKDRILRFLGE